MDHSVLFTRTRIYSKMKVQIVVLALCVFFALTYASEEKQAPTEVRESELHVRQKRAPILLAKAALLGGAVLGKKALLLGGAALGAKALVGAGVIGAGIAGAGLYKAKYYGGGYGGYHGYGGPVYYSAPAPVVYHHYAGPSYGWGNGWDSYGHY